MKIFILSFVFACFLALVPADARADYEDGAFVPSSVIAPLMSWVEAQTGIRVVAPPRVIASRSRLTEVVSRMGQISGRARALYVGGAVILDHRYFDEEDSTQLSLLVHELVHYAQAQRRGGALRCAQEKEHEAYTLQNKWLEENGHAPFVTASWIRRMASCPTVTTVASLAQSQR